MAGLTQVEGMGVFTQATRGGMCSRRWKGCAVFTQAEGMECGNFLLESVRTLTVSVRMNIRTHVKNPNTSCHTIVWTHKNTAHTDRNG